MYPIAEVLEAGLHADLAIFIAPGGRGLFTDRRWQHEPLEAEQATHGCRGVEGFHAGCFRGIESEDGWAKLLSCNAPGSAGGVFP